MGKLYDAVLTTVGEDEWHTIGWYIARER